LNGQRDRRLVVAGAAILIFSLFWARMARGWGTTAHQYTCALAVEELPSGPMRTLYQTNLAWLETNSTFPERWAARHDLAEPSRQFLHPEAFTPTGGPRHMPHSYADAFKVKGFDGLREDVGVLPWTIEQHYRLLVAAWSDGEWDAVLFESAMLSYYVANANSPFFATVNSDGQLSDPDQTGIANRFGVGVLGRTIPFGELAAKPAATVKDPLTHAFGDLQRSYEAVPLILAADKAAVTTSKGLYDGSYWNAFLPGARPIAIRQLQNAGSTLAGLLLNAWKEAGSPSPPAGFLMTDRFMPYAPPLNARPTLEPHSWMPDVSDDDRSDARDAAKSIKVDSKAMKRPMAVTVILPQDYDRTTRRYPVLYILHGSSGTERDWISRSGIAAFVRDLPLIVVMPDGGNSWYVNSPGQGQYEDYFVKELIPTIDRSFRTLTQKQARAIAGNSMGGYGAWRLAIDHSDLFQSAAALSGAFDMGVSDPHSGEPNEWITTLYGSTDVGAMKSYQRDSLYPRLDRENGRGHWHGPWLYFDAGSGDYLLDGDHHMEQFLLGRGIPHEFAEFEPGEHSWSYWDEHIRDALQFTLRHLAAPTAR